MPTIKAVADQAGVSISTVSRVINKSKKVNPDLIAKVEQAISDLNYHTNAIARGLKVSKTNRIAVIITALSRTFFTSILEGIHSKAEGMGYNIVIGETRDSVEREMELVDYFADQWVDGIILASSAYGNDKRTQGYIARLGKLMKKEDMPIPVVSLEFTLGNSHVDAVIIDYEKAAFDAVTYLIDQAGRKNIVHISHPHGHLIGDQRARGYRRALKAAGLPVREDCIVEANYTTYSGYLAMQQLITSSCSVDAIYCANDQTAVGAMKACEEVGIRIPDDVAIMGTDDVFAASIVSPTLSSISIPKFEMGAAAMSLLHKRIVEGMPPQRSVVTLNYEIIERESTRNGVKNSLKYLQW